MTDPNPITPPPELVQEWESAFRRIKSSNQSYVEYMLDQAARWGADAELEACCALMDKWGLDAADLRAARRPQPQPSIKEQALALVDNLRICDHLSPRHQDIIRRALELVPEGPAVTPTRDTVFELPEAVCLDGIELPKGARVLYREPGVTADSPVATDEELRDLFVGEGGWPGALRAIYNLGREHGAANFKSTPNPSQIGSSPPEPAAAG